MTETPIPQHPTPASPAQVQAQSRMVVYVIAESRPGYTRWYCWQCGTTTDQYWDEDCEYVG